MMSENTTQSAETSTTKESGDVLHSTDKTISSREPNSTSVLDANPVVTKDAPHSTLAELPTVYLTDGELLPLKGYWFKVRLREINGEKLVTLEKDKSTAAITKRVARESRWLNQHPRSQRAARAKLGSVLRSLQEQLSARA